MRLPIFTAATALLLVGAPVACTSTVDDPGDTVDCQSFADESTHLAVSVVIRNDTGAPLFLGNGNTCSYDITLLLADPDGQPRTWRADGVCDFTCESLQDHGAECPAICPIAPVIYLAPGGSHVEEWTGLYHEPRTMSEACWHSYEYSADGQCLQLVTAPDGDYTFTARGWTDVDGCDGGSCLCTPDASGSCELDSMQSATLTSGTGRDASATLRHPSETTVEIVFD